MSTHHHHHNPLPSPQVEATAAAELLAPMFDNVSLIFSLTAITMSTNTHFAQSALR